MAIDKDSKQTLFERGQESTDKPLGHLSGPCGRPWESDEDFQEREDAFQAGKSSVLNNKK